jgi:hypothetical protein
MNHSRFLLMLLITTPLALGQAAYNTQTASPANQPEALVRSLYTQVVIRHPLGVPEGENMKIFAPYLSNSLRHGMDLAIACIDDWHRQNPEPHLKPELGWLELGPFSGDNERALPQSFLIERTQSEKNGSSRVYVRLTRSAAHEKPFSWRVAAVVIRENGHFVMDDVIYLKNEELGVEDRLSKDLSAGCDGPRWVGFGNQQLLGRLPIGVIVAPGTEAVRW